MTRRVTLLLAIPFALVLLLSGCGSDGDSSDDSSAATTTEATDGTDDSSDSSDSSSEGGGDADAFCTAYQELGDKLGSLANDTLEDLQTGSATAVESAKDIVDTAPDEIADDAETQLEGFEKIQEAADSADTLEDAQDGAGEIADDATYSEASDNLQDYFDENCPG